MADIRLLEKCTNLTSLGMNDCEGIEELGSLGFMPHLTDLEASASSTLKKLDISQLVHLQRLFVNDSDKLEVIHGLSSARNLEELHIGDSNAIKELPGLEACKSLTEIWASGVSQVVIRAENFPHLRVIDLSGVRNLPAPSSLVKLKQLERLSFAYCKGLPDLLPLASISSLRHLSLEAAEVKNWDFLNSVKSELNLHVGEAPITQLPTPLPSNIILHTAPNSFYNVLGL